jgi:hypothetical protein
VPDSVSFVPSLGRVCSRYVVLPALLVCALASTGCRDSAHAVASGPHETQRTKLRFDLTEGQRLGVAPRERRALPGQAAADDATPSLALGMPVPDGWSEVPPSGSRMIDLRVDGAVFTVSELGGDTLANLNRWRGQLGQAPLDDDALARLPRLTMLGGEAPRIVVSGPSYQPMRGAAIEDAALAGAVLERPGGSSVFVKLVGPRAVVERELPTFDALASSLRTVETPASEVTPPTAQPGSASGGRRGPVAWTLPEGFVEGVSRSSMRSLTFHPGGDTSLDGSIVVLAMDGGGLAANLNRWRGQVGAQALDEAGVAQLPRITVLGRECAWMRVEGRFDSGGMGGAASIDDATLFGLVCGLEGRTVFVKLVVPTDRADAVQDGFLDLCRSLTLQ